MKKSNLLFASLPLSMAIFCQVLLLSFSGMTQVTYQNKMISTDGDFGSLVYSNEYNSNSFFVGNINGSAITYPCIAVFNSDNGTVSVSHSISIQKSSMIVNNVYRKADNLYLTTSIINPAIAKGSIIKYNISSNTIIWQKKVNIDSVSFSIKSITGDNENNLYLLGSYENALSGNNDLFVSKIDTNGILIWTKAFGETSWDEAPYNIVYNGKREIYVNSIGSVGILGRTTIFRLDENGNILNASAIVTSSINPRFSENFSGIVNGKFYSVDKTIVSDSPGPILIRVLDSALNTTSTSIINGLSVSQIYCNDSNLLLTGSADVFGGFMGFKTVRLDKNLNVVGSRYFNKINTGSPASSASCFINSSGESFHFFNPGNDTVFVVKANSQEMVYCNDTLYTPHHTGLSYNYVPFTIVCDSLSVTLIDLSVEVGNFTCTSISLCDPSSGITDLNEVDNLVVYPNPAFDKIFINTVERQDLKLQIFNVVGECVMQGELNNIANEIDMSSIKSGIYLIRLISANRIFQH
jgi:hypothetical protein